MSQHSFRRRAFRLLSLCLCAMMLFSGAAVGEAPATTVEDPVTALPTPTPEPTLPPIDKTEVEEAPPTPTPTPTAEPTQAPAETAGTETPSAEPTQSPSQPPSASPTASAVVSATPTAGQTPAPTAAEPTPVPETATPGAPAWDESLCDHVNPNCAQAPKCDIEGCEHIGLDENDNIVALCPLGQWLLAAADAEAAALVENNTRARSASLPIELTLRDGVNILYRSGSYAVRGGGAGSQLYVREGMLVSLSLSNVNMLTLNLKVGAVASLAFEGNNTISTIAAPSAALTINGRGSLSVSNLNCGALNVLGGSAKIPEVPSLNGRKRYVFNATGTNAAIVDGKGFQYTQPSPDGKAYLWLPEPGVDLSYSSRIDGTKLVVTSLPEKPANADGEYDMSLSPDSFRAEANKAYKIVAGAAPQSQTLTVNEQGVSLLFDGIGSDLWKPSVAANQPVGLFVSKSNRFGALAGAGEITLSGTGSVAVDTLSADKLTVPSPLTVTCGSISGSALNSWQRIDVGEDLAADTAAVYDGKNVAMCFSTADPRVAYVPLPTPASGYRYEAVLKGKKLTVKAVLGAAKLEMLTDGGLTLPTGNYLVKSDGAVSGDIAIAAGANVTLNMENVSTAGNLTIGDSATVTLILTGSSRVDGKLSLGSGAKLTVQGSGGLCVATAVGGSNCTLTANGQTNLSISGGTELPGSRLKPTVIYVTDSANAPLANREIVLKIGREDPFTATTSPNGHITLWRNKPLSGVDVVVLSDNQTFATILTGGGSPDALPVISNVAVEKYGAVTFKADGAQTMGIQYYVSNAERDMPDTYMADAKIVLMQNGECNIPDLKDGDIVTFRPFATAKEGATLSPDTVNAFAFGERTVFQAKDLRKPLEIGKQTKTYDRKKFSFDSKLLPKGASVAYFEGNTHLGDAPTDVGEYIAKVTVPTSNSKYLPGVYEVRVEIKRIIVEIYPEESSKIQGEPDPEEFFFSYDDSVMFEGDEVTGYLERKKGEFYGNYPFLLTKLEAPDYYELRFAEGSPCFFINWGPHHYMPYDPFKKIDPVYDELLFSTGETLKAQVRTIEILKIGETYYGTPVTDILDGKERPITPSLRLKGGYDQALLILTAEPELNADGGYQTDADGNRVVRGRRLTLSYYMLSHLKQQKIEYIAFSLNGATVLFAVDDLRDNPELQALMDANDMGRIGTKFCVELEPVTAQTTLPESEASAADAAQLNEPLMRVSLYMENGGRRVDIAPALRGAQLLFDASGLLPESGTAPQGDVTEMVNGQTVQSAASPQAEQEAAAIAGAKGEAVATEALLELAQSLLQGEMQRMGSTLMRYGERAQALDTKAVVPYTASESQLAIFSALMRTRPYLTTPFTQNGLYGLLAQTR